MESVVAADYVRLNPDLRGVVPESRAFEHFLERGYAERRPYSEAIWSCVDPRYYAGQHRMRSLDEAGLRAHYGYVGRYEDRSPNDLTEFFANCSISGRWARSDLRPSLVRWSNSTGSTASTSTTWTLGTGTFPASACTIPGCCIITESAPKVGGRSASCAVCATPSSVSCPVTFRRRNHARHRRMRSGIFMPPQSIWPCGW